MRLFESLAAAASTHGLIIRGGFAVEADDKIPDTEAGAAKYLLLFGHGGSSLWDAFRDSPEYSDRRANPLNRWSERIGSALAEEFSARALFPFGGPPHWPFLNWGKRAEGLENSHLGMLIHPQFGLWHAYRFALAFAELVELPVVPAVKNICRQCIAKPCRGGCPVNAFTDAGYDVHACYRYLASHPDSKCMNEGCQARVACPQGANHRYEKNHAAFHMNAFVTAMATAEFSEENGPRTNSPAVVASRSKS